MEKLTEAGNIDGHYGQAMFDQPQKVSFYAFPMELRFFSFTSTNTPLAMQLLSPLYSAGLSQSAKLAGKPL